jgi:hypothetical protein
LKKYKLRGFLGKRSCLPDNSILLTETEYTLLRSENQPFKRSKIPTDFMKSSISRIPINDVIQRIKRSRETQECNDSMHTNLCNCLIEEMNQIYQNIKRHPEQQRSINLKALSNGRNVRTKGLNEN